YDRLRFESVGGWHVGHLPGLSTVWRLSTVKALQASRMSVATTRPDPLASSVTGASSVMAASSCSTAVPPVAIVTVRPGPTPRIVESSLITASGLWQLDELQLGKRGRRERGDGRVLDRVQLVGDHRGADDVLGRRDHPARAVPEDGRGVPRPVQRDDLVLVQLGGASRADRHRLAHADVEGGARAGGDGVDRKSTRL